jgi:hypothetical protein
MPRLRLTAEVAKRHRGKNTPGRGESSFTPRAPHESARDANHANEIRTTGHEGRPFEVRDTASRSADCADFRRFAPPPSLRQSSAISRIPPTLLLVVEAVTSHGPVSPKRRYELEQLLSDVDAIRIYVSGFPDFRQFKSHMTQIAWETEVWIQEIPDHLIHFNGDRLLRG